MENEDFEEAIDNFQKSERKGREGETLQIQILAALYYTEHFLCSGKEFKHTLASGYKILELIEKLPEVKKQEKFFAKTRYISWGL